MESIYDEENRRRRRNSAFVRQAAILASAGILVRIIGFAYRLPLTALIGDEGNAIYGASYNLYLFFLVVSSAGFPAAISKMVATRRAREEYHNAHEVFRVCLLLVGGLGLAGALMLFFGANFFVWLTNTEGTGTYYSIVYLAPTVFLVAVMAVFRGYFQGFESTGPTGIAQLVEQVFAAIFSVVLAMVFLHATSGSLAAGAAGASAAKGIGAVFGLGTLVFIYFLNMDRTRRRLKRCKGLPLESRWGIVREAVFTAFPIIIGTAIFSITAIIDTAMVNGILEDIGWEAEDINEAFGQLVGKYLPLSTLPVAVATSLAQAAIPSIASSLATGDIRDANYKINKSMRIAMMFCIPAAVGMGVLADQLLLLLFPSFPEGGALVRVGAISIVFLALNQVATGMLQACDRLRVPVYAALAGCSVKIVLNAILIPIYGINVMGAVISTIVCYMLAASINLFVLMRVMGRGLRIDIWLFLKPLMAASVMGFVCFSVYHIFYYAMVGWAGVLLANGIAFVLAMAIGGVAYLFYLAFIGGMDEDDIAALPMGRRINLIINSVGLRPAPPKPQAPPNPWDLPPKPPLPLKVRLVRKFQKQMRRIFLGNKKTRRVRRRR